MNNQMTTTTPTTDKQMLLTWIHFTEAIAAQVETAGELIQGIPNMNLRPEAYESAQQTYQALLNLNEQLLQAYQAAQTGAAYTAMPTIALPPLPAAPAQLQAILATWQVVEPVFSEAIAQLPAGSPFLPTLQAVILAFMTFAPRIEMSIAPNN